MSDLSINKQQFLDFLQNEVESIKSKGLYKQERIISSPQKAIVKLEDGREVINLCANNYLGLADNVELISTAKEALDEFGFGLSSVRFICGTQTIHKTLENALSKFLRMDDTILYSSCFDANGGLFETLLGPEDAIISDSLNHASIIDGVRLSKAKRFRYQNNDMDDLKLQLQAARNSRMRLIVTDGVFSMDGIIANLPAICDLADEYDAMVMVDDSHATGFIGNFGRGTHEYHDVIKRVDILTSTLGKALGGASGGYTSGRKEIVAWLRQRSRPYLFSNTLAPMIAATTVKVLELLEKNQSLIRKLHENSNYFRKSLADLGFTLIPGEHPIIPVMLNDATLSAKFAEKMLNEGIYVISFSYPVVPHDQARIRTQMSAALERHHLDHALHAFKKVGKELRII